MEEPKLYELYKSIIESTLDSDLEAQNYLDLVWAKVNEHYAKKMGSRLDITKEENKEKLSTWLANKARYPLLDSLICDIYQTLTVKDMETDRDNTDFFFVSNLRAMNQVMESYYDEIAHILYNTEIISLTPVNKEKTIQMVKEVLTMIDPSKEWLAIYESLLASKKIIYLNELSHSEILALISQLGITALSGIDNAVIDSDNEESYIHLTYTNTIIDIPNTIYEVIHYIIKKASFGSRPLPILEEFPPIFYELYTLLYLRRQGYDEAELKTCNYLNLAARFNKYHCLRIIMYYLIMLRENGEITSKLDMKVTAKELRRLKEKLSHSERKALLKVNPDEFDARAKSYQRCDEATRNLVDNPHISFFTYPYIVGTYLAHLGQEKLATGQVDLLLMKHITESLFRFDGYDIFKILDSPVANIIPTDYSKSYKLERKK